MYTFTNTHNTIIKFSKPSYIWLFSPMKGICFLLQKNVQSLNQSSHVNFKILKWIQNGNVHPWVIYQCNLQIKITLHQKCHFITNFIWLQVDKQLKISMMMIIGTSLCRPSIGSFFVTKTITPWLLIMTIMNGHLVNNYAPEWPKFDNYVPKW